MAKKTVTFMRTSYRLAAFVYVAGSLIREMRKLPPEDRQAFIDKAKVGDHPKVRAFVAKHFKDDE